MPADDAVDWVVSPGSLVVSTELCDELSRSSSTLRFCRLSRLSQLAAASVVCAATLASSVISAAKM
jgi:hypothetical protein